MHDKNILNAKGAEYYRGIGFMCGLEIHQRLATDKKLFCSCTANPVAGAVPVGGVDRYQRAVAGELGAIDTATKFESLRGQRFRYSIFGRSTCLVDIDEEPPHTVNPEALKVALSLSKALGMDIIDELQTMRKGVVDGSDPSAFQRTILVSMGGSVTLNGKRVGVTTMSLEEESSGIGERAGDAVTYLTDRLGIPLVEIDTDATIGTPSEAREVALHLGTLLRMTGKVQRGIGTIRQDVNVSIKGGARVEIKGVQELDLMDAFIENEVERQQKLIAIAAKLRANGATTGEIKEVTALFEGTSAGVLRSSLDKGGSLFAFPLSGFKGLLGSEINPKRRLGSEISDYAKVAGVGGVLHSDEDLAKYGFVDAEVEALRRSLSMREGDSFIIVAGPERNALPAARLAKARAEASLDGVPSETRAVLSVELCTTRFMRPIAGGSRMYPETDVLPVVVTDKMSADAALDMPSIEKEKAYLIGLLGNQQLSEMLLLSPRLPLFKEVSKGRDRENSRFVANVVLQKFTEMRRGGLDADSIPVAELVEVFDAYRDGIVTKQGVDELLKALAGGKRPVGDVIEDGNLKRISGEGLRRIVESERLSSGSVDALRRAVMSKYKLRVDGEELNGIIEKMAL